MSVKLIVCDVDGTLLSHDQVFSSENLEAIKMATNQGIIVTIASGRSYASAAIIHKTAKMNGPVIALNGAIVRDQIVHYCDHIIDNAALEACFEFSKQHNLEFYIFSGDVVEYVSSGDKALEQKHILMSESFGNSSSNMVITQHDVFMEKAQKMRINKYVFCFDDSQIIAQKRLIFEKFVLENELEEFFDVTSSYWNNIEMMPKTITKGTGVGALAAALGFKRDEVMCIGDNENDIGMFEVCDFSVAMGNAKDHVKLKAKYVTGECEANGVSQAIHKYALKDQRLC